MILIFHAIIHFCLFTIAKYKSKRAVKEISNLRHEDIEEKLLTFDPPVYKQRYEAVHNILVDNIWKNSIRRMVDFGCAEFQLFSFLKWFHRINEIFEVDIDCDLMTSYLHRIRPLTTEYLNRRVEPLVVHILQGSISDPDSRLLGIDVVVGIELFVLLLALFANYRIFSRIEHLYPNDLDALPYNIFGFIKPKIAIFTTPNADFNVLFPNFKGFRHADHKFEWTREEFELWATNIITRYPDYTVTFEGIGKGPKGTDHLGCCSQMAIFVKNLSTEDIEELSETASFGVCRYNAYSDMIYTANSNNGHYYTLIETIEYPYEIDDRTIEQKILSELQYGIQLRSNINGRFFNETSNRFEIPITELIYTYKSTIANELEAREILENANYKIEKCLIFDQLDACVVFEPEMEENHSSTPCDSEADVSQFDSLNSDWNTLTASEEDLWETSSNYQKSWLTDTNDSSEAVKDIVDGLVNNLNLPEDKARITNGINLFIANDRQKLIPLHEHERKLKINLKSQPLAGLSEAGPSYAKKRKRKLHEDDNESLLDVFKNAENERNKIDDNPRIIELNDVDGEGNDKTLNCVHSNFIQNIDLQNGESREAEETSEGVDLEMQIASREALFDPNSVIEFDDLDEFANDINDDNIDGVANLVLFGINVLPEDNMLDGPILPINADPFPNWLLHMLGADVVIEDMPHDEPHFYCQGDGIGVHPSFIEGEFEEDHSSSGSDSSSNESHESATVSNDAAEAEPTVSEVEVVSLPDDNVSESITEPPITIQPLIPSTSGAESADEFYDTIDETISTNHSTVDQSNIETTSTSTDK